MKPLTLNRVVITELVERDDIGWVMRFRIEDKFGKVIGGGERPINIKDMENEQYKLYKELKGIIEGKSNEN
jgi:hypothetical protein